MISQAAHTQFLTNTDASGRFIVKSQRTGRTYYVEPVGDPRIAWGSVDPSNTQPGAKLMHKKGDGKHRGSVDERDSLVKLENGFDKVHLLEPGTSPLHAIEVFDAQYPSK